MAIDWGSWEYSGGNGMRVGIEVDWETITNGETAATATVYIYTENQYNYNDPQVLSYSGSIDGSTSYTNNDGGSVQLRATKTYTYTYSSSSYGSSPSTRTFSASVSGTYNGVTPSNSVSSAVPARPYAAPTAPSSVSCSRVSDTSTKISWSNNETYARPWDTVWLQKSTNGGAYATVSTAISGSATSYTNGTLGNQKLRYRVAADNTIGTSAWVESGYIYTTPTAPVSPLRTPSGADQVITWSNSGMGYTEYVSEVLGYKNGAYVGVLGTVATGITTFTHTTSNGVSPYTATDKWKYAVRHKTSSGTALYSANTAYTTETPGVTSPPNAPSLLNPSGIILDPSVVNTLSWQHNPTDASPQASYELQWRLVGDASWTNTGVVSSATPSRSMAIGTFTDGTSVEWQVRNKGADPVWSEWSAPVTFDVALTPILPDPVKLPVLLDLNTGAFEASNTAFERSTLMQRFQSNLAGGGTLDVDSGFAISWSARFIAINLGRSENAFPGGHHDITNPVGWTVTNKALSSNVATLTVSVNAGKPLRARVGDKITVGSVGAPFDGVWTVRSTSWNATTQTGTVTYDCVAANVTSVASGGGVWNVVHGHGGAANTLFSVGKITLGTWTSLFYEMPFGWGAGTTPRKNGVVSVTSISLTSNVVTVNVPAPHYFAVGDRVWIEGCGAPYDTTPSTDRTVTEVGPGYIRFALTNANLGTTTPSGAIVRPTGKDTFYGNFHVVSYSEDFVVPDNWIFLAIRNNDSGQVEWGNGQSGTGWQPLTLQNGWVNYGGSYQVAQYRRSGDIVELRGLVKDGTFQATIATLPSNCRPPYWQLFAGITPGVANWATGGASAGTAHTHTQGSPTNVAGRINVYSDGTVTQNQGNNGYCDLSLIRFSVTP